MTRKTGIMASGVLLSLLLACQPSPLPGTPATTTSGQGVVSLGALPGASITIAVQPQSGMRTLALPMTAANVDHYDVTLHNNADGTQVGGTLNIVGTNSTGQFVGVPAGTYYIRANAFKDVLGTQSIVQGSPPIQSVNTVTVAGGIATYTNPTSITPAPTSLVVNLPLLDGTVGTGTASVSVVSRTTALPTADRTGLSLFNRASRRALSNPVNPSVTYQLTSVQTGASSGQTHEIWAFAAIAATAKASVPRPFGTGANATGIIPTSVTVTHTGQTLETGGSAVAINVAAGHQMNTDANGNLYYYNGSNLQTRTVGSSYATDSTVMTGDTGVLTGWVVSQGSAGFYSTGTNIMKAAGPLASNGTLAVTASNVGLMAIDEVNCLYYVETNTNKIKRAIFNGSAYIAPTDAVNPGIAPTMLAADAYGSIYYSNGSNIFKAPLDTDEITYLAPTTVVTAGGITSFSVDRGGNIYFTNNSNEVRMVGAGEATIYTVAGPGTGVGADALAGGLPTNTNLSVANNVTTSVGGRLFFTSAGAVNRFLRFI